MLHNYMGRTLVVLLALAVAGCGGNTGADGDAAPALPVSLADTQFISDNQAWRIERHSALVQADGWTSLVGLHWLTLKAHYIGSGSTSGLRLAVGPARMGMIERAGGVVHFTPEPGVDLRLDGQPLRGRIVMHSDHAPSPTTIAFDDGKGLLTLLERGGQHALRVRHADAASRRDFAGLQYWPVDRRWQVAARFVAHQPARTLQIVDMVGMASALPNPGQLQFDRDGTTYVLEAVGNPDGSLMVIMADRTSGHGSYPAGRYIDVPAPGADGQVALDFNRAYNPPCAFTPFATCPLPPPENRLDLAVEAGEMAYGRKQAAAPGAPA